MTETKYEAYLDHGQMRIKPANSAKIGKVFKRPIDVAHFTITQMELQHLDERCVELSEEVESQPGFRDIYYSAIKKYEQNLIRKYLMPKEEVTEPK